MLLVRHGQSSANVSGVLAGRLPEVHLSELGQQQAQQVGRALAGTRVQRLLVSPIDRTLETAAAIVEAGARPACSETAPAFLEVDFGDWSGCALADLASENLWKQVQSMPSSVQFPGGESLLAAWMRSVSGFEELIQDIRGSEARGDTYVIVSHADIVKMIVAHAIGLHLDLFQRLNVDPGSITSLAVDATTTRLEFLNLGPAGAAAQLESAPVGSAVGGSTGKTHLDK